MGEGFVSRPPRRVPALLYPRTIRTAAAARRDLAAAAAPRGREAARPRCRSAASMRAMTLPARALGTIRRHETEYPRGSRGGAASGLLVGTTLLSNQTRPLRGIRRFPRPLESSETAYPRGSRGGAATPVLKLPAARRRRGRRRHRARKTGRGERSDGPRRRDDGWARRRVERRRRTLGRAPRVDRVQVVAPGARRGGGRARVGADDVGAAGDGAGSRGWGAGGAHLFGVRLWAAQRGGG